MKIYLQIYCMVLFSSLSFGSFAQDPACEPKSGLLLLQHLQGSEEEIPEDPPPPTPEYHPPKDYRLIFWVHGLGGDQESWVKASNATQSGAPNHPGWKARRAVCLRPTYSEVRLRDAGIDLHNAMMTIGLPLNRTFESDPIDNFIIAHSQGGLVSRMTDKLYEDGSLPAEDRMFGGIVTFGTPHQGAMIINNTDPHGANMAGLFAQNACESLAAGPLAEYSENRIFVDLLTSRNLVQEALQHGCDVLGNTIVPIVFQDYTAGTTQDFEVGAGVLQELNQQQSPTFKVNFYGVETDADDLIWRVMSTFSLETPNSFDYFDANPDEGYLPIVDSAYSYYRSKYLYYYAIAQYMESWGLPCSPLQWFLSPAFCAAFDHRYWEVVEIRNGYFRGKNWFDLANEQYKAIIGAYSIHPNPVYRCDCGSYSFPANNPAACQQAGCTVGGSTYTIIDKNSDGVVLAESARNFPGAAYNIKLFQSNHQQMRNDFNTMYHLEDLFDGVYGAFFELEEQ